MAKRQGTSLLGIVRGSVAALLLLTPGCTNNPYDPEAAASDTYFCAFITPPTKLDPANAYYSHEGDIIDQIYEPPFTYHYLNRPYTVIPLTARELPQPVYFDKAGKRLDEPDPPAERVGRVEYTIRIKPGILYQNHPCFARDEQGHFLYRDVTPSDIAKYDYPSDFPRQGTREIVAADYARQVRRLADPRMECPILSTVKSYILGLDALCDAYDRMLEAERAARREKAGLSYNQELDERNNPIKLDYMQPEFPGVRVIDEHTYVVVLKRKYPQIIYWMCMHFFAPVPHEAIDFYAQPAMVEKGFSLLTCPVGSGAYYLKVLKPNELIVLERNPNYHEELYPSEGEPGDREAGLLADAGRRLPFIQRQELHIEKEAIPAWSKFLQGYYDRSGITSDVFDQAIQMQFGENPTLSPAMIEQGIRLITSVNTAFYYTKFNLLDDVVGGYTEQKCKLRRAITIALDYNEYLDIFANGRGIAAAGPIPPGIFGYIEGEAGTNPFVDEWDPVLGKYRRQPIGVAQRLMREAGYPDGRGPDGKPLTLTFDHSSSGDPTFRSRLEWMQRSLERIGVRLKEDATDLSRYREKLRQGNWQLSSGGWLADYPDPENFLFLFYGPNGKVKYSGSNADNYESAEYDRLFEQLETMANGPRRQALISQAVHVLQRDAAAGWQYFPVTFSLQHDWYHNVKPHEMVRAEIRYHRLDAAKRATLQREWNRPVYWPVIVLVVILVGSLVPEFVKAYRRERGL